MMMTMIRATWMMLSCLLLLLIVVPSSWSFVIAPPPRAAVGVTQKRTLVVGVGRVDESPTRQAGRAVFVLFSGADDSSSSSEASKSPSTPPPKTFREAEVLGLKYMQEGQYKEALQAFQKGLKLPGSRTDVVRTKLLSGPSPVGGSTGGMDSQSVQTLDEFEVQAAYYNMACAYAQLNQLPEALQALRTALENGFDNTATVRSDPDLEVLQRAVPQDFEALMADFERKNGGFNPFGFFGKKK